MAIAGRPVDIIAAAIVLAAFVAWLLGPGPWSLVLGLSLVCFGPGYLLLRSVAADIKSGVIRLAFYMGTSLAIAVLIGFALAVCGVSLGYDIYTVAYLLIALLLWPIGAIRRPPAASQYARRGARLDSGVIVKWSVLIWLPLTVCWFLLATSPSRSPWMTEMYFHMPTGQVADLPRSYQPGDPLSVSLAVRLSKPTMEGRIDITANGRPIDSVLIDSEAQEIDRLITLETSALQASTIVLMARLVIPGRPDQAVWLNLSRTSGG